jgi:hypothetical protein
MGLSPRSKNPDVLCRKRYRILARECRTRGLNTREIEKSRKELNCQIGSICHLDEIAYKPTGIALGCPIPDRQVARRLWHLSRLVEKYMAMIAISKKPTFAFVPPHWYHTTLVNRTHFDTTAASLMVNGDHLLSEKERRTAQTVISQTGSGPISVQFSGLILTSSGRLIVPGFPSDDRLYEIRYRLTDCLPAVRVHMPRTVHIKLGHILFPLNDDQLRPFLNWLALCGQHINGRLSFGDLYTPAGRILL